MFWGAFLPSITDITFFRRAGGENMWRFYVTEMRGPAVAYMLVSLEVFGDCDKNDFRSGKSEPRT